MWLTTNLKHAISIILRVPEHNHLFPLPSVGTGEQGLVYLEKMNSLKEAYEFYLPVWQLYFIRIGVANCGVGIAIHHVLIDPP